MSQHDVSVVLNADDLGLAPAVNASVAALCRAGVVRSASLLVTGPAAAEAIALAHRLPELGVGLHLAWIHERPAAEPGQIPALLDREGRLVLGHKQFMARLLTGRLPLEQVRREAEAQLERMVAAGLRPTHLDSHQHLHLWPPLFEMCLELCRAHGIPFIRLPGRGALETGSVRVGPVRRRLMAYVIGRVRGRDTGAIGHTDEVWGMLAAGHLSRELLLSLLGGLQPGRHEIMCHPATEACDAYTRHRWGYAWAAEHQALSAPEVGEMIARRGLRVTNFREMAANNL
ncbi:ChbG/HpnK family deacetylase [bacterium]|nr:ChbG/HpnK family deacetylase [bacterium]